MFSWEKSGIPFKELYRHQEQNDSSSLRKKRKKPSELWRIWGSITCYWGSRIVFLSKLLPKMAIVTNLYRQVEEQGFLWKMETQRLVWLATGRAILVWTCHIPNSGVALTQDSMLMVVWCVPIGQTRPAVGIPQSFLVLHGRFPNVASTDVEACNAHAPFPQKHIAKLLVDKKMGRGGKKEKYQTEGVN